MREEIDAAVCFMGRIISASHASVADIAGFKECLSKELSGRFQGHWHETSPGKGQGYRSIRIHPNEPVDPVLHAAAKESKFSLMHIQIPVEFTLWIDPKDVSCRFGDIKPTFCTVMKNEDNKASTINVQELLEAAKALYSKQQHIIVRDDNPSNGDSLFRYNLSLAGGLDQFNFDLSTSPPNGYQMYGYVEGYLPPPNFHHPNGMPNRRMMGDMREDSTPPTPNSQYHTSFTSTAVNTTPRKNGKGSNFRKGSGRVPKNHHLHHHHSNSDTAIYNHNHNNNHNSNGSSSSSSSSSSNGSSNDRFHWVRGGKGQQQQHNVKDSK